MINLITISINIIDALLLLHCYLISVMFCFGTMLIKIIIVACLPDCTHTPSSHAEFLLSK